MLYSLLTKRAALALAAVVLLGAGACTRDLGPTHAPVATARLTFDGTQQVTVHEGQAGAVTLAAGTTSTSISAEWLTAGGQVVTGLAAPEFSLHVLNRPFTSTGTFSGTISGLMPGANTVTVQLLHGDHADFAVSVVITVAG